MALSGEVRLGGRLFNVVNYEAITALNEHFIMKFMRATGLDRIMPLVSGESDEAYVLRVHSAVVDTLQLHILLGGFLLPAGKVEEDWDLKMADETAQYIAKLTAHEDKAELHRLGLAMVFDFFRGGLASLKHFLSALEGLNQVSPSVMTPPLPIAGSSTAETGRPS